MRPLAAVALQGKAGGRSKGRQFSAAIAAEAHDRPGADLRQQLRLPPPANVDQKSFLARKPLPVKLLFSCSAFSLFFGDTSRPWRLEVQQSGFFLILQVSARRCLRRHHKPIARQ